MHAVAGIASSVAALLLTLAPPVRGQTCLFSTDPTPSGVTDRPAPPGPEEHPFLHSAIHLQGAPALEKWTGCLIHRPSDLPGFERFTSAIVVDNPNLFPAVVTITYYDSAGTVVGLTGPHDIAPEGFHVEAAIPLAGTPGAGSARVTSLSNDQGEQMPVVGATLLNVDAVGVDPALFPVSSISDADLPLSSFGNSVGANSMQQLQVVQPDKTKLWWGPLPLSVTSTNDFFHRQAPFLCVVNPNDQSNSITVRLHAFNRRNGRVVAPVTWRTATLPPHGTLLEKTGNQIPLGLWDHFLFEHQTRPMADFDVTVRVVSTNKEPLPLLGDGVMTDFFALDPQDPSVLIADGSRFRMASTLLASDPGRRLVSPDLSYQPDGIVATYLGLVNVGTADAGPITFDWFGRNGFLGTSQVASLPQFHALRIEPGFPGYPASTTGFGWVRISACSPLVGWTVREILDDPDAFDAQFHKVFGEALAGLNGAEPGDGFETGFVLPGGSRPIRKVAPLLRVDTTFPIPGYSTAVNTFQPNLGEYSWRFFDPAGIEVTLSPVPFQGLPWSLSTTTLEEPEVTSNPPGAVVLLSGRIDHRHAPVEGIKVLGDVLDEYGIPDFAVPPPD